MPQPPAQRDTESARAYAAFVAYCGMGADRSLDKLRQQIGKKAAYTRQLEEWSGLHDWQARVRLYDAAAIAERAAALDATRRQAVEQFRQEIIEDQAALRALWRSAANKLAGRLRSLDEHAIETPQLSGLLRAVAALADATTNQKAAALGVDDVLKHLENLDAHDDEPTTHSAQVGG